MSTPSLPSHFKRKTALTWALLSTLLAGLAGAGIIYVLSGHVRTDVAFVGAQLYEIKSPVTGLISGLSLKEFQTAATDHAAFHVDADALYPEAIKTLLIEREKTRLELESHEVSTKVAKNLIKQRQNALSAARSAYDNAEAVNKRAVALRKQSLISVAEADAAALAAQTAAAQHQDAKLLFESAQLELDFASHQQQIIMTKLAQVEQELQTVESKERRTVVTLDRATAIAKVFKVDGQWVEQGETIAQGYALSDTWVDAYIDEQDLVNIKIGSAAEVTFDSLPDTPAIGVISAISPVGGGILSPLSPNYSSGHVLRVTQRYIARIPLSSLKPKHAEDQTPHYSTLILPGMSARVHIQIP